MWNIRNSIPAMALLVVAIAVLFAQDASGTINDQLNLLNIDTARLQDVLDVFGPPLRYFFGDEDFDPDNLPDVYILEYPSDFYMLMHDGWIIEYRVESNVAGYIWQSGLHVGSTLDQVVAAVGEPAHTVVGEDNLYEDGVLYKDIQNVPGQCYYRRSDLNVRFFLVNNAVCALYVTRSDYHTFTPPPDAPPGYFYNVSGVYLSGFDLSADALLIASLTFDERTKWPDPSKLPPSLDPAQLMEDSKNPGLGVRGLHLSGVTGAGVKVGMIDLPMETDHPDYAGKISSYYDTGTGRFHSTHGPAVASLCVGTTCGTAPGATIEYAAAPSWNGDSAHYAAALDWIVVNNAALPYRQRVHVVSVSAAPSGPGSPFTANQAMWDEARARAETAGIVVLDGTEDHGFVGPCWYDPAEPENVAACTPGYPGQIPSRLLDRVLAPASPRTTACHDDGNWNSYTYWGRGELGWSIPYTAGVMALGWQIHPDLPGNEMLELVEQSAHVQPGGCKIIDPPAFIALVQRQLHCYEPAFCVPGVPLTITAANNGAGYQWYKDDQPLAEDLPRLTGTNTCTLTFGSLLAEDAGSYRCVFENGSSKAVVETESYVLEVGSETLPVSEWPCIMLLAALFMGVSAYLVKRRLA